MLQQVRGRKNSPVLMSSGSVLPPALGIDGGSISPLPMLPHGRWVMETVISPMLTTLGLVTYTSAHRVSSTVLPGQNAGPALPSAPKMLFKSII